MTTNQILIGISLILVLAVGAQVLASRLHIPAIIVLLPAGFVAGALTTDVNPDKLLGPAFEPLVSLSVAVILYDAGLGLDLRKLKGHVRKVVTRLIVIGVLITWVLAASVARSALTACYLVGTTSSSSCALTVSLLLSRRLTPRCRRPETPSCPWGRRRWLNLRMADPFQVPAASFDLLETH